MEKKVIIRKHQSIKSILDKDDELMNEIKQHNINCEQLDRCRASLSSKIKNKLNEDYKMPPVYSEYCGEVSNKFEVVIDQNNKKITGVNILLQVSEEDIIDLIKTEKKPTSKIAKLNSAGINVNQLIPHLDKAQRKELLDEIIGD